MTQINTRGQLDTAFSDLVADMNHQLARDFPGAQLHHGPKALELLAETARQADLLLAELEQLAEHITGANSRTNRGDATFSVPSATLPAVVALSRQIGQAQAGASRIISDLRRHL